MIKTLDLNKLDNTNREPRKEQKEAMEWLQENWSKSDVFAITVSTGGGKSYLARAIQIATHAAIITNTNMLVDQYKDVYPEVNVFKGQEHYDSDGTYQACKLCACLPEYHTIYNPVSFRVAKKEHQFVMPDVIVADESHSMLSLLQELTSQVFVLNKHERYRLNLDTSANLVGWLRQTQVEYTINLQNIVNGRSQKKRQLEAKIAKMEDLIDALICESEKFAIWLEDKQTARGVRHYLHIKPTSIPVSFLKSYFKGAKLILLSATILPADIRELAHGKTYKILELGSCIPVERRPFYICPTSEMLNYPPPYASIATKLDEILEQIPLRPAIIHATYSDAIQISKLLKAPHLVHTQDTKQQVLDEWMRDGGVLIASGMSEGLDLKGELCRLNIVTKLQFPNLKDDYVQKRMNLPEGKLWYGLQTLKHIVQAYGRSTRGAEDYSVTICLDSRISRLLSEFREETPKFFMDAVCFFSMSYKKILDKASKFM